MNKDKYLKIILSSLDSFYLSITKIFYIAKFEFLYQIKKLILFLLINIIVFGFYSYFILFNGNNIPILIDEFYYNSSLFFGYIIVISVSYLFSGIICSEYNNKTGLIFLPLTSKFKMLSGKYIANLLLTIILIFFHYLILSILGYGFYGSIEYNLLYRSFLFLFLFSISLGSITTFFSAMMLSSTPVILIISGLVIVLFEPLDIFIRGVNPDLIPIYSLSFLLRFPINLLQNNYTLPDFQLTYVLIFIILVIYAIIFYLFSIFIFKKREF